MLAARLAQTELRVPEVRWVRLEPLVPKEQPTHWAQTALPVHQGWKERLGRPVASVPKEQPGH